MMLRWNPARLCAVVRAALALLALAVPASVARGQNAGDFHPELADRPIAAVNFEGLKRVSVQEVQNNVRAAVGDPYDPQTVVEDVHRLNRLGQFKHIDALVRLETNGSVTVTYRFVEQQIVTEVQVVGNRLVADSDLIAVVSLVPKGPRDDNIIKNAQRNIEEIYRKRGYYLTAVQIDEAELDRSGVLIFRVIEGPRVKVRAIEFEGNQAFTGEQLLPQIRTRTALLFIRKGELDEELLRDDVAALSRYYTARGYLDVRVDRRIELSPDNTEAKVTFIIAEGNQYHLRSLRVHRPDGSPTRVFAREQILAIIELKPGDVYSDDLRRKSVEAIRQAYAQLGYVDVLPRFNQQDPIRTAAPRVEEENAVDLDLTIDEGQRSIAGEVNIAGNMLTRDNVIRRDVRITPGLPIDGREVTESENRLLRTRLFSDARITLQPPDPEAPDIRDVLVEVKERNTGAINFGVAVGSDAGLFGELSLTQNNFDITDYPESFRELITGRAFRGAGQQFNITLRPGTELFQFSTSWTEPRLFDSDYALTIATQYMTRFYRQYDETRYGASISIGRRFGDVWNAALRTRVENVELSNIDDDAPTAVFADAGPTFLTDLGISLTRTTIATLRRPGSGSRLELAFDQIGALGGDLDFSEVSADYTVYFTISEDFLGRKSTLKLNTRAAHIFGGDAPIFERFFLGGRSFRGFDFRTVSPKGIAADTLLPSDDPVGGDWLFFLGGQYEFPVFEDALTGVVFIDSGTVTQDVGFDDYRVSIGAGVRIYIPQFGDVPIALDFAYPLIRGPGDETQLFSFSAELPF